jgi:hypothetical protein
VKRLRIVDLGFAFSKRPIGNPESAIPNLETHPLPQMVLTFRKVRAFFSPQRVFFLDKVAFLKK